MGPMKFEKTFKAVIPNFKEFKIQFNHNSEDVKVSFISRGQIVFIRMYRTQFEIDVWANHFIAYFKSGKFDRNSYHVTYTSNRGDSLKLIGTQVHKNPMGLASDGELEDTGDDFCAFMQKYRLKHGDTGFKQVPKPL